MLLIFVRVKSIHFKLDWTVKLMECAKQEGHLQLHFLIAVLILAALSVTTAVSLFDKLHSSTMFLKKRAKLSLICFSSKSIQPNNTDETCVLFLGSIKCAVTDIKL